MIQQDILGPRILQILSVFTSDAIYKFDANSRCDVHDSFHDCRKTEEVLLELFEE